MLCGVMFMLGYICYITCNVMLRYITYYVSFLLRYITCYVVLCLSYVIEHVPFMSCYITCYVTFYTMLCYVMFVI